MEICCRHRRPEWEATEKERVGGEQWEEEEEEKKSEQEQVSTSGDLPQ